MQIDINRSLNISNGLRGKLDYSINLLRKAERIALAYDDIDGFHLAFSGGKDSQALFHVAQLAGVRFKARMNLTSVDPPEVIRFVKTCYPEVERIPPKDSIYNIAVKKGILPTQIIRWCCAEYKEDAGAGKVTLIGIRNQESFRRSKRKEVEISNHKFSGNLEQLDEYRSKLNSKRIRERESVNITNVDKESVSGCIRGKDSLLISPIIHWTEKDVWEFLNALGVPHCCLYDEGYHRIGCICCPMQSRKQKEKELLRWPHVRRNWINAIMRILSGGGTERRTAFNDPAKWRFLPKNGKLGFLTAPRLTA